MSWRTRKVVRGKADVVGQIPGLYCGDVGYVGSGRRRNAVRQTGDKKASRRQAQSVVFAGRQHMLKLCTVVAGKIEGM